MKDDKKTKDKDELGKAPIKDDKKLSSAVSNKKVRDLAEAYMKKKGMTMLNPKLTFDVSPERGAKIAKAYEEMKHEPQNPKVKKAYAALIQETIDQWDEIKKSGLKVTKITPEMGNPYPGGSKDIIKDVTENNHLYYFPTESGYGSTEVSDHPLLQKVKVDGEEMPANDIFRIVHDVFGHVKEGEGFGPKGEENAWMNHKQMYSPEAQKALTAETRGQNSWVNFGPLGEQNRKNPEKTTYAEQKAGLLPDWVVDEEPTTGREKLAGGGKIPSLEDLLKQANERIAQREKIIAETPEGTIGYRNKTNPKKLHVVSPDLRKENKWRVTHFDEQGPFGHTEGMNFKDALKMAHEYGADLTKKVPTDYFADGGRVYMQEGGDPGQALPVPDFDAAPGMTSPYAESLYKERPSPTPLPLATPEGDLSPSEITGGVPPTMGEEAPEEPLQRGITPNIKRTHVPVWDLSGSQPKLTTISHDMVQEGVKNGLYAFDKNTSVPVVSPEDGRLLNISADEAQDYFNQGYQYADPQKINEVKYSGAGQTAIAALEAGARGILSSPVASALEHTLLGVPEEDILGRMEAHEGLAKTIETATFVAPLLLTGGEWAAGRAGLETLAGGLGKAAEIASKTPLAIGLEKAGSFIPEGAKWYSKIGYGAARNAFEGALFQASDELGRAYLNDPEQTAETIMASLGAGFVTGGLLGFGFHAGKEAYGALKSLKKSIRADLGGEPSGPPPPPGGGPPPIRPEPGMPENSKDFVRVNAKDVPDYEAGDTPTHVKYDSDIPDPEKQSIFQLLRTPDKDAAFTQYVWEKYVGNKYPNSKIPVSMISPHPKVWDLEQAVAQKFTGQAVQNNIDNVINTIHDNTTAITGTGQAMSRVDVGETLMENILQKHEAADRLHAAVFDQIRRITKDMPLNKRLVTAAEKEMQTIFHNLKTSNASTKKFLDETLDDLKLKTSVDDLKNFATTVRERANVASGDIRLFGYDLARVIRKLEGRTIDAFADTPGLDPDYFLEFSRLNEQRKTINRIFSQNSAKYEKLAKIIQAKGEVHSFADFARIFGELTPEKVTKALESASYRDKVWLKDPANGFAKEFELLRKHELNKIVQKAKYTKGTDPRASTILSQLFGKEADPRMTQLILTEPEIQILKEMWWLHRKLPAEMNASGSGRRISTNELLAGLVSPKFLAAQLVRAGGERGFLELTRPKGIVSSKKPPKTFAEGGLVSNDVSMPAPPQMPNTDLPVKSIKKSFAQAVLQPPQIQQAQKLAEAAVRGQKMITNSVKSVFDPKSSYKIPTPTPKGVEMFKGYIKQAQENPSILLDAGHPDFPEMSGAFSRSLSSAVSYIGSLEPKQPQALPFDNGVKAPPSTHNDIYNHVLKITEQPLYVLEKIKQGTVIPEEVGAIKTIYPALYQTLQNQITEHLVEAGSKGATIPYRTKIGLSAFLGSPIDTTMTPEAIMAAQPQQQNQPPQGAQTGVQPKRSTSALGKMATMAQTPGQARTAERSSGK